MEIINKNFTTNPQDINFLKIVAEDAFAFGAIDKIFCVFNSMNDNILTLLYPTRAISIVAFDFINNQKLIEIKNAHKNYIISIRYYKDLNIKREIILSLSDGDNTIKLWNYCNWECIFDISNIYEQGYIFSACFLNHNNQIFILSSNIINAPIQMYDLNCNKIKDIKDSIENTIFIDTYKDDKSPNNYIITGNKTNVKIYDIINDEIYTYIDNSIDWHISVVVYSDDDMLKVIESCYDGNIRIWDFKEKKLITKIKIYDFFLYGICMWNKDYLFIGCDDCSFKLLELKSGKIIKEIKESNESILTIIKFNHPDYGECLLTKGYSVEPIKLYICAK